MKTSFPITVFMGNQASPLDPLQGQMFSIDIKLEKLSYYTGVPGSDPPGCKSRAVWDYKAVRTAIDDTTGVVEGYILQMLDWWTITSQICTPESSSSISIVSEPDALNLEFGCPLPMQGFAYGDDGYPEIVSMTVDHCQATILDVINNRVLGNPDFSVTISTVPGSLP